ncbi:Methyltransferase ustM [Colletotrichum sidae]|uniref:Methyltransferase ustM n=1 Tax=Colletotrichum sidae TaxID=1347389 RepID=A0A4R8TVP0_9PEZI|nr:Methyltransferase ustM [Colletotrichum sidae]
MSTSDSQTALALALAPSYLHDPKYTSIIVPQLAHRLRLCARWSITPSSQILDIGCGQGDSALVLSHIVSSSSPDTSAPGHATALDPAPGTYGSPYTLAQSQSFISSTEHGKHITFVNADAPSYLAANPSADFDVATLCHSLWYFPSPAAVSALFRSLSANNQIRRLCFAEYALKASRPSQVPHELAVQAQRRFHQFQQARGVNDNTANVRCALDPDDFVKSAEEAGWKLEDRGRIGTPGLLDGKWEVGAVLDAGWVDEVKHAGLGDAEEEELLGYVAKIRTLVDELKDEREELLTLDAVWVNMSRT